MWFVSIGPPPSSRWLAPPWIPGECLLELDQLLVYYNFEYKHYALSANGNIRINILGHKRKNSRVKYHGLLA
jgi:hypothetical protein